MSRACQLPNDPQQSGWAIRVPVGPEDEPDANALRADRTASAGRAVAGCQCRGLMLFTAGFVCTRSRRMPTAAGRSSDATSRSREIAAPGRPRVPAAAHWDAGIGNTPADYALRLKTQPPSRAYLAGVHVSSAALVTLNLEEFLRCLHASGRDGLPGCRRGAAERGLWGSSSSRACRLPRSITATPSCNYVMSINYGAGAAMPWT